MRGCADVVVFVCLRPQEAETGFVPSVQDFDKKLAEADAYLQILIDQLKVGCCIDGAKLTSLTVLFFHLKYFKLSCCLCGKNEEYLQHNFVLLVNVLVEV